MPLLYTLKCLDNVCGKLDIVDGDKYTNTNLNRYIIADESTIGKYKVDIAKNILRKHPNLDVDNHQKVYGDFIKDHPRIDTLVSAVDKKLTPFFFENI